MESTSLELASKFILNKKKANHYYVIAKLFDCNTLKIEKQIAKLDGQGNTKFLFNHVYVQSHLLGFEIFSHRKFLPDKLVGKVQVAVSDLMPSPSSNGNIQESHATYEVVSEKRNKGILKLTYKLCMARKSMTERHEVKLDMESKKVVPGIGHDIGLFKMVGSFRTPLLSLSWT